LVGGAAVTAAVIAVRGLETWKRQLVGNARYDVARRMLRTTYELREAIEKVRNPFMSSGELDTAWKVTGLSEAERSSNKVQAQAYQTRWESVSKVRTEFLTVLIEAEVLWGRTIRSQADGLLDSAGELFVALIEYLNPGRYSSDERFRRMHETVFGNPDRKDEFSTKITEAIEKIETEMRPHLKV